MRMMCPSKHKILVRLLKTFLVQKKHSEPEPLHGREIIKVIYIGSHPSKDINACF